MRPVDVVTDSTAYLPAELAETHGIDVVSLYVSRGTDMVREVDIDDYAGFYDALSGSDKLPTTSQPSTGDFRAVYERLLDQGSDVLSVHISGGISGTVESARSTAAQLYRDGVEPGRIEVVDSRTTCAALGMLALCAARAAAQGHDVRATRSTVEDARSNMKMWFAVDTLEFLKRGGRIGAAGAWIGSTLRIKPILTVEDEITPIERVRTKTRSYERMVDYARQRRASGCRGWAVQHIQDDESATTLAGEVRGIMDSDPFYVSEVGPVIGSHVGPGLLGFGALPIGFFE